MNGLWMEVDKTYMVLKMSMTGMFPTTFVPKLLSTGLIMGLPFYHGHNGFGFVLKNVDWLKYTY